MQGAVEQPSGSCLWERAGAGCALAVVQLERWAGAAAGYHAPPSLCACQTHTCV
jgi:hypothetical protein